MLLKTDNFFCLTECDKPFDLLFLVGGIPWKWIIIVVVPVAIVGLVVVVYLCKCFYSFNQEKIFIDKLAEETKDDEFHLEQEKDGKFPAGPINDKNFIIARADSQGSSEVRV